MKFVINGLAYLFLAAVLFGLLSVGVTVYLDNPIWGIAVFCFVAFGVLCTAGLIYNYKRYYRNKPNVRR